MGKVYKLCRVINYSGSRVHGQGHAMRCSQWLGGVSLLVAWVRAVMPWFWKETACWVAGLSVDLKLGNWWDWNISPRANNLNLIITWLDRWVSHAVFRMFYNWTLHCVAFMQNYKHVACPLLALASVNFLFRGTCWVLLYSPLLLIKLLQMKIVKV